MNAAEMWERFCEKSGIKADYDDWAFGGAPDALAELVLNGIKTATPYMSRNRSRFPKRGTTASF